MCRLWFSGIKAMPGLVKAAKNKGNAIRVTLDVFMITVYSDRKFILCDDLLAGLATDNDVSFGGGFALG
ncbi:hypothetical protein ACFOEK_09355 [Litoribrevibacter euphylliae]|uniref:Uncharacterized protein n=1 Tax=Litoribrevibacter euphylliae TaxID=1834034 RepID=A0ABV7HBG6_9GAMM